METELFTFPQHLVISGFCFAQSLVFCVVFCRSLFVPFFTIILSVFLGLMAYEAITPFWCFQAFLSE